MIRAVSIVVLVFALGGCATFAPPIPDDYRGPVATVSDSVKRYSTIKADFFYLKAIDGKRIEDSRSKTLDVNYGRGMHMKPVVLRRNIPARRCVVTIVGRTGYAAPILALTNTVYKVSGEVSFTPERDKTYIVNGELGKSYSAVWIEEADTKNPATEKIEVKGSTALGFFQK